MCLIGDLSGIHTVSLISCGRRVGDKYFYTGHGALQKNEMTSLWSKDHTVEGSHPTG